MAERAERQFEEVKANLAKLKNDRDEALMLAEVDKQQASERNPTLIFNS